MNLSWAGCLRSAVTTSAATTSTAAQSRIAFAVSGKIRTAVLAVEKLQALVLTDDMSLDVFYCVGAARGSELDELSIRRIRAVKQVRHVRVSYATGTEEAKQSAWPAWEKVACAQQLVRAHAAQMGIVYRAVVRLRADTRFDCRYDFRAMAATFQERAGVGNEWLAIPHARRYDTKVCEQPRPELNAMWTCCVDSIAVGTPLAMDDYSTHRDEYVDNVGFITENYVLRASFHRFFFNGSADSGAGPYGTAVSGDFRSGAQIGGPCFSGNAVLPPLPKHVLINRPALKPFVCRDPSAARLFTFSWRCIQIGRFYPFGGLFKHCGSPDECVGLFYEPGSLTEESRCPPNVRILDKERCASPENSSAVPCERLGCLAVAPRLPPAPEYVMRMYTNRTLFELEVRLHAPVDPKFIVGKDGNNRLTPADARGRYPHWTLGPGRPWKGWARPSTAAKAMRRGATARPWPSTTAKAMQRGG